MAKTLLGTILLVSQILTGFGAMQHCACGVMGPFAVFTIWLKPAIAANTNTENDRFRGSPGHSHALCAIAGSHEHKDDGNSTREDSVPLSFR